MDLAFKGNSGCTIEIVPMGDRTCVRKWTHDPQYAPRLRLQAEKQKRMRIKNTLEFIRIPEVISGAHTPDSYAFDMEHFRCDDVINFFEKATQLDIDLVVDHLIQFIDCNIVDSSEVEITRATLIKKYEEVREKVELNSMLTSFIKTEITPRIGEIIMKLSEVFMLPIGNCHGDLTFSNVLITKDTKHVVLVDWLDSFLETPLQDIVKLRQDTKYHWSFNLYTRHFDKTKIMIIMEYVDKKVDAHFRKYQFYEKYYLLFQLLNFLRILPYAKDAIILKYLEKTMSCMVKEI